MINEVILSLGSNIGQRLENLQRAIDLLGQVIAVEGLANVYETEPWGFTDQPDFLNTCLIGKTRLSPLTLLAKCKEIETHMGRDKAVRWGPRLIDIDILYFNDFELDQESIRIPHPEIPVRPFVLVPLADIVPDYQDPSTEKRVQEMKDAVDTRGVSILTDSNAKLRRPIHLAWGIKTYIMAILNITPDSFSGDGILRAEDVIAEAVLKARGFIKDGADIIDIGGESTRPGSKPISASEEIERVIPIIQAVRTEVDVPISVDTYRSEVAMKALNNGADWINDVWGLRMDDRIAEVASDTGCPIILMHNRSQPKNVEQENILGDRFVGVEYDDLIADITKEMRDSVSIAIEAGVGSDQIIIDPGVGFGKTVSQNLELISRLDSFSTLGYPLLVGTSRKSFIGFSLKLPADDRLEGTAATVAIAIEKGADIVRVHDVKAMARVAGMSDAILRI